MSVVRIDRAAKRKAEAAVKRLMQSPHNMSAAQIIAQVAPSIDSAGRDGFIARTIQIEEELRA